MPARRPGSRKPTRPRSSCASFPTSRASSAPSTRGWPATPRPCAARSRSSTCRTVPTRRCPQTEAGRVLSAADKIDTLTVVVLARAPPHGLARPVRAAASRHRPLPARCRRRARPIPHDLLAADVREFVEERLEGYLDVPVEFVRAALRSEQPEIGAVAAQARFLAAQDLAAVHEVYSRAARIVGDAADAEPVDDSLLKEPAEQRLAEAVRAQPEPGTPADQLLTWAVALAPVVAQFFDDVLVMDPDERVKANRLRLLRDVRAAVGRLGDLSQIPALGNARGTRCRPGDRRRAGARHRRPPARPSPRARCRSGRSGTRAARRPG